MTPVTPTFDPMAKGEAINGIEIALDQNRKVTMIRFDIGVELMWSRPALDGDFDIPEFDAELDHPNGQPEFRKDGKVCTRVALSYEAAVATRELLGMINDPV